MLQKIDISRNCGWKIEDELLFSDEAGAKVNGDNDCENGP